MSIGPSRHIAANTRESVQIADGGYTPPLDVTLVLSEADDYGHTTLTWTGVVHLK